MERDTFRTHGPLTLEGAAAILTVIAEANPVLTAARRDGERIDFAITTGQAGQPSTIHAFPQMNPGANATAVMAEVLKALDARGALIEMDEHGAFHSYPTGRTISIGPLPRSATLAASATALARATLADRAREAAEEAASAGMARTASVLRGIASSRP